MPLDTIYRGYMLPDMFTQYGKSEEFVEKKRATMVAEQQKDQELRQQKEQGGEQTNLMNRRLGLQEQENILRGKQLGNMGLGLQYRLNDQAFRQKQEANAINAADAWNRCLDGLNNPTQGWGTQVFPDLGGGAPRAGPNPSSSADDDDPDLNAVLDLFSDEWQPND